MIAGAMFTVTQAGQTPCAFSIAPEGKSFGDENGSGQVQVTTTAGCGWTAASNAVWITITSGAHGNGPGTVGYSVTTNNASASRSGTLMVAGRTFTVTQAGEGTPEPSNCEYSVGPVTFTPCMAGGRLTATLTTQANCSWTVNTSTGWLSLPSGRSGKGAGTHCDRLFGQLRRAARRCRDGAVADADGRAEHPGRASRMPLQRDAIVVQLHVGVGDRQLHRLPGEPAQ